jgi:hypothetical protein
MEDICPNSHAEKKFVPSFSTMQNKLQLQV